MNTKVVVLKCPDYNPSHITPLIGKLLELLGGIERFVKPHTKVFLKPNLLSAALPEEGITTHPEIVKEIARRVKELKAKVFIGDSPGGGLSTDEVYEKTGMKKICQELGVELVQFDKIEKIRGYPLAQIVFECESFISLPKFKTHSLMVITGGIKNSFGLVPGLYKTELHLKYPRPKDFGKVLVDIFSLRKPDLVIVDGVVSMAGEGPAGGILKNTGLILGSSDAVALDTILARITNINPLSVFTTQEAYRRNLGEARLEKIEVKGEELDSVFIKDFPLPAQTLLNILPKPVLKIAGHFFNTYPEVNNKICRKCEVCLKSCPVKAISVKNRKIEIDYNLCIKCLCCYEFCPRKAIYLRKSLALRLWNLVKK